MNNFTTSIINNASFKSLVAELKPQSMPIRISTSKDTYVALGHAIVAFQTLESALKMFIQVVLDMDQRSIQIVTSNLSFKNLVNTLNALCEERQLLEKPLMDKLLANVRQAEDLRNALMHSHWIGDMRMKSSTSGKSGLKITSESFAKEDLSAIRTFLEDLTSCAYILLFKYLRRCKREGRLPKCAVIG